MAEEVKEKEAKESKKDNKKILTVIAVLILAAAGLYYVSTTKSQNTNTGSMNNGTNSTVNQTVSKAPENGSSELTSKKWTWINTKMNDGKVTTPSKEGAFTTTFQSDGRLVATTDCNTGNAGYTLGADNALTIGPMASTMMYCEGSSQDAYFQQLANVGSYKISNGQLWLMLKYDSGTMIFQ